MIRVGGPDIPCDLSHDGKVDMPDIGTAAASFGSARGDSRWNPPADITGPKYLVPDGKVDMRDIDINSTKLRQKMDLTNQKKESIYLCSSCIARALSIERFSQCRCHHTWS